MTDETQPNRPATRPQTGPPVRMNGTDMVRLLARLSRKGASLQPIAGDDDFAIAEPGARRPGRADASARVRAAIVRQAEDQGWLRGNADDARLRLSEAGALALRRGLAMEPVAPALDHDVAPRRPRAPRVSGALSPVARLHRQRNPDGQSLVSTSELEAAERLERDFMQGQMMPRVTANWDRAALGMPSTRGNGGGRQANVADHVAAAQERVRRALSDAGPEFADMLVDVCCLELGIEACERQRGWPPRSGKILLKLGLGRLARHYGVLAKGPARSQGISHWGVADYRPQVGPD